MKVLINFHLFRVFNRLMLLKVDLHWGHHLLNSSNPLSFSIAAHLNLKGNFESNLLSNFKIVIFGDETQSKDLSIES